MIGKHWNQQYDIAEFGVKNNSKSAIEIRWGAFVDLYFWF